MYKRLQSDAGDQFSIGGGGVDALGQSVPAPVLGSNRTHLCLQDTYVIYKAWYQKSTIAMNCNYHHNVDVML